MTHIEAEVSVLYFFILLSDAYRENLQRVDATGSEVLLPQIRANFHRD